MKPAYEHVEFGEDCSVRFTIGGFRVFRSNGITTRNTS